MDQQHTADQPAADIWSEPPWLNDEVAKLSPVAKACYAAATAIGVGTTAAIIAAIVAASGSTSTGGYGA